MDRFLIAPINTGLQTNLKPWQTPDDSFEELSNVHLRYGRVEKRFGSIYTGSGGLENQLTSRARINLGTGASGTVPGTVFKIGQMFSIDDVIYTVNETGTPGDMLTTNGARTGTYNTTTGAYVFTNKSAGDVYFYPAEPIMGLTRYQDGPINDQPAFAFDTQFAYEFNGSSWERSDTANVPLFTGDNYDYFYASNYRGILPSDKVMYVTNFNAADGMYYYDGTNWGVFKPYFAPTSTRDTGPFVTTARIIIPFNYSLLLLNTIENDGGGGGGTNVEYPQRVRWCAQQYSPLPESGTGQRNGWYQPGAEDSSAGIEDNRLAIGAGFLDAPTKEQIIGAQYIKNRLIVFFEESTWELTFLNNVQNPFLWQQLNSELGAISTGSEVPFDKMVLGIGKSGVHACNGSNVERIDEKIPLYIYSIQTEDEQYKRIQGIREYVTESVYWTLSTTSQGSNQPYPTQILVYNYENRSWATYDDCITVWGYFEQQTDLIWQNWTWSWEESDFAWNDNVKAAESLQVIFGNPQGYICLLQPFLSRNAANMQITDMVQQADPQVWILTIVDNNLSIGDYILLQNLGGITDTNTNMIYEVKNISLSDNNTVYISSETLAGTYTGGGVAARVSRISLKTKEFNPYVTKGRNLSVAQVNFAVDATAAGAVTCDYYVSSNDLSMVEEAQGSGALMGNGVLETFPYEDVPFEKFAKTLWHPVYPQADGEFVQLKLYLSDDQMLNRETALEDFVLQGFVLITKPTSYNLQ